MKIISLDIDCADVSASLVWPEEFKQHAFVRVGVSSLLCNLRTTITCARWIFPVVPHQSPVMDLAAGCIWMQRLGFDS